MLLLLAIIWPGFYFCFSQSVTVHANKNTDYAASETFTVLKGEFTIPKDERALTDDTLFEIVKASVKRELELKGYRYIEDSTAQLKISYVASAYNVTEGGKLGPLGEAPVNDPANVDKGRYWSNEHSTSMFMLEMTKGSSTTPIWSAESKANLTNPDVDKVFDSMITKMFKKFPGRNGKRK